MCYKDSVVSPSYLNLPDKIDELVSSDSISNIKALVQEQSNLYINLRTWRAVIGLFLSCIIGKRLISGLRCYSTSNLKFALSLVLLFLFCGDIVSNPGPKKAGICQSLTFCHWNLNSILSDDCFKVSVLKSFNALHN